MKMISFVSSSSIWSSLKIHTPMGWSRMVTMSDEDDHKQFHVSLIDPAKPSDYYYCESCGSSYDEIFIQIDLVEPEDSYATESFGCYGGSSPNGYSISDIIVWLNVKAGAYPFVAGEIRRVISELENLQ